jgi:hypothetical protein
MVVICGKCGNNTCNGGYGEFGGIKCDQCPDAYREAHKMVRYETFRDWFNEREQYGLRCERFYETTDEAQNGTDLYKIVTQWMEAAFEAGRNEFKST